MAKANGKRAKSGEPAVPALSRITVAGFKSIGPEQSIEIRPLTLLAGAHSSGKSSMMQPLLLLKQTLEAPYDPGALLLNGPNVRFTKYEQMLFQSTKTPTVESFSIGIGSESQTVILRFQRGKRQSIEVASMTVEGQNRSGVFYPGETDIEPNSEEIASLPRFVTAPSNKPYKFTAEVIRRRCFLDRRLVTKDESGAKRYTFFINLNEENPVSQIEQILVDLLHLPGSRGNPERTYPVSAIGARFKGTFENYVASIVANSAAEQPTSFLDRVGEDLHALGLTWKVTASAIDDTQVELRVGRLPQPTPGGANDLVNIADVGFGVSQTLPVVVALRVAKPGQLVYIEQPEIHLHPRAQVAMARLLADAANRGVRVVAETHSSLVLLGVQSLVAEGVLAPDKVKLHWFRRNEKTGATDITSADLDADGSYGDWPEDFADVEMKTDLRFIEAADGQLKKQAHDKKSPTATRH
jgi:predicted ATPase